MKFATLSYLSRNYNENVNNNKTMATKRLKLAILRPFFSIAFRRLLGMCECGCECGCCCCCHWHWLWHSRLATPGRTMSKSPLVHYAPNNWDAFCRALLPPATPPSLPLSVKRKKNRRVAFDIRAR